MGDKRLFISSVTRKRKDGSEESIHFKPGVTVLVGEGNTGKTKWLQTIDYLLGDEVTLEEREDPDNVLFQLFISASAVIQIGDGEMNVERRWKEPGTLGKVYVDGQAENVKDYSRRLMNLLNIPIVHFPQGDPYGARKWPELTWRSLVRHIYRRETAWSDIADQQPEVDQHACIAQFLGIAEKLFSAEFGELVFKNKRLWDLQSKRDQFMTMLDRISKDLVGVDELGVALTPESIEAAKDNLEKEELRLAAQRKTLLAEIKSSAEATLTEKEGRIPDVAAISERLVNLQAEMEALGSAIKQTEARIAEVSTVKDLLTDELEKLKRAADAGAVLADLRVTHCPACDQPITKTSDPGECYVCGRPTLGDANVLQTRRIQFENEQVQSELEETHQLLAQLAKDRTAKLNRHRHLSEQIAELNKSMRPIRQAAAAVLPPELFLLDVQYGRIQEKMQQLVRIRGVLDQRDILADEIQRIQKEIADAEAAIEKNTGEVEYESLGDRLRDGMNTYLNRIFQLNPHSWLGQPVAVRIDDKSVRFRVGDTNWKTKLGATQRLYFLFAYHYALLSLCRFADTRYPGLAIIDFPANLEDRKAIADKENFILEPFVDLLKGKEFAHCQMIAAGRSFEGLDGVEAVEFNEVWK
jgi:rubrerythrin